MRNHEVKVYHEKKKILERVEWSGNCAWVGGGESLCDWTGGEGSGALIGWGGRRAELRPAGPARRPRPAELRPTGRCFSRCLAAFRRGRVSWSSVNILTLLGGITCTVPACCTGEWTSPSERYTWVIWEGNVACIHEFWRKCCLHSWVLKEMLHAFVRMCCISKWVYGK